MTASQPLADHAAGDVQVHIGANARASALTADIASRDALLAKLYQGVTLSESFASIASAVAQELPVDRVSLLRCRPAGCSLIATSTQPKVDRRTRQVRLLERLVSRVHNDRSPLTFELGSQQPQDANESSELDAYLDESGCREIHVEAIRNESAQEPVAFIVLERFRILDEVKSPIADVLGPLHTPLKNAITNALGRDALAWSAFLGRFKSGTHRRTLLGWSAALGLLLVAGFLVPVELKVPVEGRIVATQQRHVFAPADGIVTEVLVSNGQSVKSGEPLVVIRSPQLELLEQSVQGELATARTRLESLLALRSRDRESNLSVDEQALRTEIQGLETQAMLLQSQRSALTLHSPIDGQVDGWDLQQSLALRPVSHGQFLLDVVATDSGWTVELEIPDQQMGYVLKSHLEAACICSLRLRSNPTQTYLGELEQIDDVAHLNLQGKSVVRAKLAIRLRQDESLRSGATVIAQVHCGEYSLAFVWLRGIAEWWRGQTW